MRKVVSDSEFQNKMNSLNRYRDELSEAIDDFNAQLKEVEEVIEAIKMCANTYGGYKHVSQLASINFNNTVLYSILDNINDISINTSKETYYLSKNGL